MAYVHKDNTGSIFVNTRKDHPTKPDFTGSGVIDGKQVWISAWNKSSDKGDFMTLAFQEKEVQSGGGTPTHKSGN